MSRKGVQIMHVSVVQCSAITYQPRTNSLPHIHASSLPPLCPLSCFPSSWGSFFGPSRPIVAKTVVDAETLKREAEEARRVEVRRGGWEVDEERREGGTDGWKEGRTNGV